jgi:hypothetical protein
MEPSDDADADIRKLKQFYDSKSGLKPKNYGS